MEVVEVLVNGLSIGEEQYHAILIVELNSFGLIIKLDRPNKILILVAKIQIFMRFTELFRARLIKEMLNPFLVDYGVIKYTLGSRFI